MFMLLYDLDGGDGMMMIIKILIIIIIVWTHSAAAKDFSKEVKRKCQEEKESTASEKNTQ